MSFLPPLGLPVASLPGTPANATSLPTSVAATASPSGRMDGADIVTQPQRVNAVTPSRTMLEVRRAVEADMIARAEADAQAGTAMQAAVMPAPEPDAQALYAAARKALPV